MAETGTSPNPAGPLAGLRVLALEQAVAGPLCTRHLADLGADVIKVERREGGDFARRYDDAVKGLSSYFVWLNRGKRSLTLDVKHPAAAEILGRLLARADVLVQNLGPGAIDRLGFPPAELRRRYPSLVICSISGYGRGGPYEQKKAFDLLLQGETGVIATTGTADAPAKLGISVGDIGAGVNFSVQTESQWEGFCRVVCERPEWLNDARYSSPADRLAHRAELETAI